jgi:S-adenosylmethionine hydrolase
VGQLKLRLASLSPGSRVIELVSDLPPFRPDLSAYLLPAIVRDLPKGTVYLCVVDPGVGGQRVALAVEADGCWFVGPDNGLLSIVARRARQARVLRVDWRPLRISASFHGRDLFAPVAAMLAAGQSPTAQAIDAGSIAGADWPDELARVIYVDHYGNLMTGLRASSLQRDTVLGIRGLELRFARTFCEVPQDTAFWYENAFGLVELAVNKGEACGVLGLGVGDPVC